MLRAYEAACANLPDRANTERNQAILWDLLSTDMTLEEVGEKHELTRERCRQVLVMTHAAEDHKMLRALIVRTNEHTARQERNRAVQEHLAESESVKKTAEHFGMAQFEVKKCVPLSEFLKFSESQRTDPDLKPRLIESLQRAFRRGGGTDPISFKRYDVLREESDPTSQRQMQTFGTWKKACTAAEVPSHRPPRLYTRAWDIDGCMGILREFLEDPEESSESYGAFSIWLMQRPEYPSSQTVRNRGNEAGTTGWVDLKARAMK